jgi:hypothetical protein
VRNSSTLAKTPITQRTAHYVLLCCHKNQYACEGCTSKTPRGNPALSGIVQQQWRNTVGNSHDFNLLLPVSSNSLDKAPNSLAKQISAPLLTNSS